MAQINDKIEGRALCPNCSSDDPITANMYDRIISEFDHDHNHIEMPIDELSVTYKVDLYWICNECNNIWKASLFSRLYENKECPYCIGKQVIPGRTSFKALYPKLVEEYSSENKYDPDYLLPSTSKNIIWNCHECNQIWSSSLIDRVNNTISCPYCNGRKAIPDKTSFKITHSHMMDEWDNILNILLVDPDMILANYNKPVWWKCNGCGYKYPMSPARKVLFEKRKQISCLKCKGIRRRKSHII